jgi:hypothetical protein
MATSLKKHLNELEPDELVEQILNLAKRFKDVKTYFDMELGDEKQQAAIVDSYKKKIHKQFFRARGVGKPKTAELRKLINHFKSIAVFPFDVADLMLYRVEMTIDFIVGPGEPSDAFHTATLNAYEETLKLIREHQLEGHFRERCEVMCIKIPYKGWGFGKDMAALTNDYFPN